VKKIKAVSQQARYRDEVEIIIELAVEVDNLRSTLLYHEPNIVHFCGHGEGNNGLVVNNEYGQKQLVNNQFLAGLFKTRNNIECVVFNACYSEVQAELIHEDVNCVIGTNQAISDEAGIEFSKGFYDALINGQSYQVSFDIGCSSVKSKSISESEKLNIKIKDNSLSFIDIDLINSKSQDKNQIRHINPENNSFQPIKYLPKFRNPNFVGRQDKLREIHHELNVQNNNRVAIYAVSGMGGVGKSELALEYAWEYIDDYSGGVCWLSVRDRNLATEIIQFIQLQMDLEVPQKLQGNALTLEQQVEWCWKNWKPPEGSVLVIFDDVTEYKDINKLLPRINNQRFKLLITTRRLGLDNKIVDIPLDVLSEDDALSLLKNILGEDDSRIEDELQTAKELCQWLGYLPLGLELVGRYLVEDADLSIAEVLKELQSERLEYEALNVSSEELESTEMTARLGVNAAFNLTWEKLDSKTKEVGELLSLFAPDTIAWKYVESVSESLNWKKTDVRKAKKQLYGRNVIKRLEQAEASYQIHPLIREFLQVKLQASPLINELKQAFTSIFIEIAKTIPFQPTLEVVNSVKNAIPHLTEVAQNQLDTVSDENLYSVSLGLGRFYQGQGLYVSAEPWNQQCLSEVKSRLGENHPDYAKSLNNLGILYSNMGRYDEAEPIYKQALELTKQLLGENHPETADNLCCLAIIYDDMGRYEQAEPLYIQALELYKQLLGENHPETADSLESLAEIYRKKERYEEA
ncbi:MAG: tetratricopeptide repeat protein, partial [Rivularia sp. ALOHA_DT_140]|nr:tetratricopeptide repeat protein [Rivularia sp. ALOHA_DT_140]